MDAQSTDGCVLALISSFLNGLDVFKKLRKKRKKNASADDDQSRLTRSLQRGPIDIRQEYDRNYAVQGERFRAGDGLAHASLATLALKLNNGLVGIISTFLTGSKKNAKPDYAKLTTLSEASRRDAIDALSQLSLRLSHSSLSLLLPSKNHRFVGAGVGAGQGGKDTKPKPKGSKSGDGKKRDKSDIRRIHADNVSAPHLAIIRPKARRSASGGSRSPPPAPKPPHRRSQSAAVAAALSPKVPAASRSKSTPNLGPLALLPPPPPPPMTPALQLPLLPAPPPSRAPPPPAGAPHNSHQRRPRAERQPTPSVYTFASDSTKMGEIPMRKWAEPFDFDAMARLNAEAALRPPPLPPAVNGRVQKRRGLFGLFRKTGGVEA